MATWNVTGQWVGQYEYNACDELPTPPPPVKFTLIVRQGWFGRFRGTIQDDPVCGAPEQAQTWGRVNETGLTFMKRYPVVYVGVESTHVKLRDYLEMELGLELDENIEPMPIHYEGLVDAAGQSVQGTWHISAHGIPFQSREQWMVLDIAPTSGTWKMERQVR